MRTTAILVVLLLAVYACATPPDHAGMGDADPLAEGALADAGELAGVAPPNVIAACISDCAARYVRRCPRMDTVEERDECYRGCEGMSLPASCNAHYLVFVACRLNSPPPVYACDADGSPYPRLPDRCAGQQWRLALCRLGSGS